MRVLIVDHDPDRGWVWSRQLERHGANVDRVTESIAHESEVMFDPVAFDVHVI